jgi:cyanophycinase-like exopeptidase
MPRFLTIMGSGETAPTMVKTHRSLLERVGGPAVLLNTPYGFQENADDISARAQEYFRASVGTPIEVADWRSAEDPTMVRERALALVGSAGYVFAGPGSPTYALRQWAGTPMPALLAEKLQAGGGLTFASAAALTLGVATVPVYEIYKVGEPSRWVEGLDLLSAVGLRVALIPHYDNKEGGGHDTRFCYLGERRLRPLEDELPDGAWVLGVDEHTGLVIDVDSGAAEVVGNGVVTVRVDGASVTFASGTATSVDALRAAAEGGVAPVPVARPEPAAAAPVPETSLLADAQRCEAAFDAALAARDAGAAAAAVLELDDSIVAWSADTLQSDELDRARATLRRMVVRLGEAASGGLADPQAVVAPFVEAALAARVGARTAKAYDLADQIRDDLVAAGVEVRDAPGGTEWSLR